MAATADFLRDLLDFRTLVPLAFRLQDDLKVATAHFGYLIRWKNFLPNFARSKL